MAVELEAGPDDTNRDQCRDEAEAPFGHEERDAHAEGGGGVAGGEALEAAAQGDERAVEAVLQVGVRERVGPRATEGQAEKIVEEAGERGAEEGDDGETAERGAFGGEPASQRMMASGRL